MMADEVGAKRLKTSQVGEDVAVEPPRGGIAQTPSGRPAVDGNHEGNHEHGPPPIEPQPVAAAATVDLSRVDKDLVARIASFLGESRELLNVALTCKSFGWRRPTSAPDWSFVEEVARQGVCSRATEDEMSSLPQYVRGTTTWLSILHRYEHLLLFDVLLGRSIEYRNGDKTTVHNATNWICTAVSSHYVMRSGTHYAEFQITGTPDLGIVRPMPNLDAGAFGDYGFFVGDIEDFYPAFLAQRSDGWGACNIHACQYSCGHGVVEWTDWNDYYPIENYEGMDDCNSGDTVGMLLNLEEGTLTVYRNNRRLGVLKDGLAGSYCWYVTIASLDGLIDGDDDSSDGVGMESVVIRRATAPALNNV